MTSTAHPVDSTFYACCNAIGRHARTCAAVEFRPDATPPPPCAVRVEPWEIDNTAGRCSRFFSGPVRSGCGAADVYLYGEQEYGGALLGVVISVEQVSDMDLDAAGARALAADLLAAADELDSLAAGDETVVR